MNEYYDYTTNTCTICPNSPGYCINATAVLSCNNPALPILNIDTLSCSATCDESKGYMKGHFPKHEWNNNQDLYICRTNVYYVDFMSTKVANIGTREYPQKRLTKVFVEQFNNFDSYPNATIKVYMAANTLTRNPINFKNEPIIILDKEFQLSVFNETGGSTQAMLNVTDKTFTGMITNNPSTLYRIIPVNLNYNLTQKLDLGKITDVQNSVMYDYPMTAIRGSITIHRYNIQVDLTTVDVNQKFLNMDEADGKFLHLSSSSLRLQGIFSDVKNAISAKVYNNTFVLTQTNYILTVRPSCLENFDFTKTEFNISSNTFSNTPTVTVSYHLFFYKGFSNVTYFNNTLNNIVGKGYSHFAGQYVVCPNLLPNNTIINFLVIKNYWDMSVGRDDARIDLQVQETNPNITFSVKISNNSFIKLFSNNYFILVQNYNPSSYLEFSGNYFYQTRIEDIAITFQTDTAIYLFDNYVDDLYNRLRHFLYLDGPSKAHFKNLTINNAYTGLDYNAYALILADVADGKGVLIFENCNFTNWNIQMHYGINVAVKVQSLQIINTLFTGVKMLPLWHILNIKEASQLVISDVVFNNYSFQSPKSSNGFAINVINLDIKSSSPLSIIKNVVVQNMSTNFFQLINAHSDETNITGYLQFKNMTIKNNTFDAEISLFQFSGFLLDNAYFDIEIADSQFMNNNFTLYGNLISLMQNMMKPLTIRNTKFYQNYGAMFDLSSGNIALTSYPTQLKVDNCSFISNTPFSKALIVVNENCKSFIYNSYFLENYSTSRGSVIMADYQETQNYFENCTFVNNSASVGGVFYTQFGSMIDCLNCTVQNNFGLKGGVVYTSNDGYIKFRKSKIIWNKSLYSSILVTLSSPTSYTEFSDSLIYQNKLLSLSDFIDNTTNQINMTVPELGYLTKEYLNYLASNVLSIQNSVQLGLIYALNSISSNLRFQNLVIDSQENILSSFEASIVGGNLTIQNTIVTDTQNLLELTSTTFNMSGLRLVNISCNSKTAAKDKYLMSALLRSNFYISGLDIVNTTNPIAFMLSSYLTLIDSVIHDVLITSDLYQPISLTDSTANFTNFTVKNVTLNSDSMVHLSFSYLNATGLQMTSINQTFITASDSNLYINSSNFVRDTTRDPYNLTEVDLTSIEYIRSCLVVETSTIFIQGTSMSNFFTTDNGGAVASTNCDNVTVVASTFQANQASMGGGLYLYCDEDQICNYQIDNSTFTSNIGVQRGGALHYNYFAPLINLDTINFVDNIAPYGQNISAYPYKLVVTNADSIRQQVSGQIIINPINVEVQDYYGNVINIDNTTKIELQSWNITTTQIQGASTLTVSQGKAIFDEVTLLSDPGREDEHLKIVLQQYDNTLIDLTIEIDFRQCLVGEALQKQKCIKCPIGKFSLELNTSTCMNCPLNSQCPGGSIIDVNSGYWRAKFQSSQIHECLFSPACLYGFIIFKYSRGGTTWLDDNNVTWPTVCEAGYGGNLCHACVHHDGVMYTRSNKHECLKCSPNQTLNALRLVGIGLCLILALSVLILLNLRRKGTNYLAVLTRMMTNYMQIISFAASFNLGWPESLKRLYDSISIISQSADAAFSLDCFFDNAGVNDMTNRTPTFFLKAMILLILPVMALVIIFIFWGLFSLCKKYDRATFTRNTLVSIIVVLFLAHPTLTSNAFSMLNCYEIEAGEQWLQADLEIKCWNSTHTKWFFFVGLPMLIVWVIGMPVLALILMYTNRKRLGDEVFFSRYRMLYQGLKKKHFYWEIVNTFRKISIVSINVFLSLYPDYIKAIYAMLMLAIIFKMQEILQPYEIPVFNWIEQREQIASIVTFYAGLYFVKADVSETFKYIIIIIVFFVNAWFLVLWSFVAVNTFKWNFTKRIAAILRKIICKKLKDEDLKPVDDDAIGFSGNTTINNTKGNSVIVPKGVAVEGEFDELEKMQNSKRADGPDADKSQYLDQSDMPLKKNDQTMDLDSKTKDEGTKKAKKKRKTQKSSTDSNNIKSKKSTSSQDNVIKGSIIEDKSSKKREILSSFSEFSDKIDQQQPQIQQQEQKTKTKSQKVKEIPSSDEDIQKFEKDKIPKKKVTPPKKEKQAVKQQIIDETEQKISDEDSSEIIQEKKETAKKNKVVEKPKKKKQKVIDSDQESSNDDTRKTQDKRNKFDESIEDINMQSTTQNLKMPYSNSIQKKYEEKDVNKSLKVKAKQLLSKPKPNQDDNDGNSSSSFAVEENRVYTIKKKATRPIKGKKEKKEKVPEKFTPTKSNIQQNDVQAMSMSDDSFAQELKK